MKILQFHWNNVGSICYLSLRPTLNFVNAFPVRMFRGETVYSFPKRIFLENSGKIHGNSAVASKTSPINFLFSYTRYVVSVVFVCIQIFRLRHCFCIVPATAANGGCRQSHKTDLNVHIPWRPEFVSGTISSIILSSMRNCGEDAGSLHRWRIILKLRIFDVFLLEPSTSVYYAKLSKICWP